MQKRTEPHSQDQRNQLRCPSLKRLVLIPLIILCTCFSFSTFGQLTFVLVDAGANQDIKPVNNGDVLDLSQLPASLNIRADINPGIDELTESVVFSFNAFSRFRTENAKPYALGGDGLGDYFTLNLPLGTNTLTATLYHEDNGTGSPSYEKTIYFTVIQFGTGNQPPVLSVDPDLFVCKGEYASIQIEANDPEGQPLTFSLDPLSDELPNLLSLDPNTGEISGLVAGPGGSSTFFDLVVRASDPQGLFTSLAFTVGVFSCEIPEAIISLTLVDADTDEDIMTFDPFQSSIWELDLATVPFRTAIRANINPLYEPYVESVRFLLYPPFGITPSPYSRIENIPPYSLGGDNNGNYYPYYFSTGTSSLVVYPYSEDGATGIYLGGLDHVLIEVTNSNFPGTGNLAMGDQPEINGLQSEASVSAFPNPFQSQLTVEWTTAESGPVILELRDPLGRVLYHQAGWADKGYNRFELSSERLPDGPLFLRVYQKNTGAGKSLRLIRESVR